MSVGYRNTKWILLTLPYRMPPNVTNCASMDCGNTTLLVQLLSYFGGGITHKTLRWLLNNIYYWRVHFELSIQNVEEKFIKESHMSLKPQNVQNVFQITKLRRTLSPILSISLWAFGVTFLAEMGMLSVSFRINKCQASTWSKHQIIEQGKVILLYKMS